MNYRIAFCGLGSIATRHLRNVTTFLSDSGHTSEIDLYRSSLDKELPEDISSLINHQYMFADGPKDVYDIVFVTNPTSIHYETLDKFKLHTKSFFIEKPVFSDTSIDERIFEALQNIDCYVACPLRYSPVLQYVKKNVPLAEVYSARAISSSYLPDWRQGQDYRQCYSAHRSMGGGVGIDLIHEWDYLTAFFGIPKKSFSIQDKISHLEIDSDDIAIYIAQTDSVTIELHLDYFGRKSIRTLDLYMRDETIRCDIIGGTISFLKANNTIQLDTERNTYQMAEIEHFFDIINHRVENDSTIKHAYAVLKLAKGEL